MRILIDADGCPVVDITVRIAKANNLECIIHCDTSHYFERDRANLIKQKIKQQKQIVK